MKLKLVFFITFFIGIFKLQAQSVLSSSGNSFQNNQFLVEYVVGELCVSTSQTSQNILTQGFLQAIFKAKPTGLLDNLSEYFLLYYPNPTDRLIVISTNYLDLHHFILTDLFGKKVIDQNFEGNVINLENLVAGVYIIHLFNTKSQLLKTLKIVKL
ncbi:MAG: T9SS C-terminal target domain-containing protein [Bacteroidetes bacterium]|nr:MAG: T9SS C-terminal target domain-containing protein [Bacteroidota bacterium]